MEICKYCKKEAFFPPKTKWGGWCCVESFYKCPGYKEKLKKSSNPWNRGKIGLPPSWNKGIESPFKGKTHKIEVKEKISNSMKGNGNANHRGDRQSFYNGIRNSN